MIEDSLRILLRIWNYSAASRSKYEDDNNDIFDNNNIKNNNNSNTLNNDNNDKNVRNENKKIRKSKTRMEENNNLSTGGNFVRDLAFIQTAEIVLNQIGSLEILFRKFVKKYEFQNLKNFENVCSNDENKENTRMINISSTSTSTATSTSTSTSALSSHTSEETRGERSEECAQNKFLPSSLFSSQVRIKVLVDRIIQKLLNGMSSNHCKIALLCLTIVSKNEILLKYFVTVPIDDRENENEDNDDEDYDDGYHDSIESSQKTFRSNNNDKNNKNNNNQSLKNVISPSDDLTNWKQDKFDRLVDVLRKNRTHWHPTVKATSGHLFDTLLNYLE